LSKDRSKEILREISSLRRDLEGRLDAIEARLDPPSGKPDPGGPAASVSTFSLPAEPGSQQTRPAVHPPAHGEGAARSVWPAAAASGAPREVTLTVRPLVDVELTRAIETSLADTEGIESARLASLSGDSAVIQALVAPGVSVVQTLRRRLPVAFDVTESSDNAISISLASPDEDEAHAVPETEPEH
jgi:hypothetical protein